MANKLKYVVQNDSNNTVLDGKLILPIGSSSAPSLTFTSNEDTGIFENAYTASARQLNIVIDGSTKASFNSAGITSHGNVYSSQSGQFRNYAGVWKATTGTTGNGFEFVSADGTAMTLSSTGDAIFEGNVTAEGYLQSYGVLYLRNNIQILNKAGSGWLTFATRDTSGSEAIYNLDHIGTIDIGNGEIDLADANNYARITVGGGSAQLGLFRSSNSVGGGYIGADVNKFRVYNDAFAERFAIELDGTGAQFNTTNVTAGGNTMWHAGNDGSSSGLDADMVDGVHASQFFRRDTNLGYFSHSGSGTYIANNTSYYPTPAMMFVSASMNLANNGLVFDVARHKTVESYKLDSGVWQECSSSTDFNNLLGGDFAHQYSNVNLINGTNDYIIYFGNQTGYTFLEWLVMGTETRGNSFIYKFETTETAHSSVADKTQNVGSGGWSVKFTSSGHSSWPGYIADRIYEQVGGSADDYLRIRITPTWASGNTNNINIGSLGLITSYGGASKPISTNRVMEIIFANNIKISSGKKLFLDGGDNTYITESSADTIKIFTGGTEVLELANNVTTFAGNVKLAGNGTDNDSFAINFTNGACAIARDNNDLELHAYDNMIFGVSNTSYPTSTEHMRIDSSGNVGIGTNSPGTFYPGNHNLVVGDGNADSAITVYANPANTSYLLFADGTSGNSTYTAQVRYNHSTNHMEFATNNSTTAKMTLDDTGNVGIGTTSPLHDLQIGTAATNGSYSMMIEGNFANDALASNPRINLIDTNFGITAGKYGSGGSDDALGIFAYQGTGRGIVFAHTTAGSGTHLKDMRHDMFIDGGTGKVGIGTTAPDFELDVAGSIGIDDYIYHNGDTNTYIYFQNDSQKFRTGGSDRLLLDNNQAKFYGHIRVEGISDEVTPNQNLLDIGSIKIAGRDDIYGNATKTTYGDYVAKYVNDGTGGSTIRIYVDPNFLVNNEPYMVSIYYENLIGTLSLDWCDQNITGNPSASGTSSAPTSGRLFGYGTRSTYDNTFRFVDINLSNGSGNEVTLHSPKVEAGYNITDFVATERTDMTSNSKHLKDLKVTHSATFVQGIDIDYGGSDRLSITGDVNVQGSTDLTIPQTRKLRFDGAGGHTYMTEESDSNLKVYVAATEAVNFSNSSTNIQGNLYLNNVDTNTSETTVLVINGSTNEVEKRDLGSLAFSGLSDSDSGNRWGVNAFVASDGVMEVGKYIDFHNSDGDTSDYAFRITSNGSTAQFSAGLTCTSFSAGGTNNLNGITRFGYTANSVGSQFEVPSAALHTFRCDSDKFRIWMGGTGGSSETFTVLQTGRIGINDSTPDYTLDVSGNVSNISIYASHDIAAYSDARVKDEIETIPNALDKVNKLRGVTFKRTDEGSTDKRMMGVIAQEVLDIIPEVVNQRESDGHYSVSYGNMVGILIEAVKELKAEVEELKKQIK